MTVRDEVKDVILRSAYRILESIRGESSPEEKKRLQDNLEARIPLYAGRYPILDLVNQMESAADAGHAAAVATNAAIKREHGEPTLGWDESLGKFTTPISAQWRQAIQESAAEITREHFQEASGHFDEGEHLQATEQLCSGIICSIMAIAAEMGWPHHDRDDDLRVMVGLAVGSFPAEGENIYQLLQSASQQGQDLNSAFAAAMGQPADVRSGAYGDAGRTPDEAMLFARTVVNLADQLGQKLR